MKLGFAMPHMLRLKATMQPWGGASHRRRPDPTCQVGGKAGVRDDRRAEHHVIPRSHVDLSGPFYFNAYTAMAHFAGATETIRANSCIAILPAQHPIVTAKALSTMDWLSGGRVTVTFAVGWLEEEFALLGVPFHERGAMAEEYIQAILALWTQENPELEGQYVAVRDVAFEPKPVQRPHLPVWFGGDADPVLRRVARYAQGWWPFLTRPEMIAERIDFIRSQSDYNGQLADVYYGMSTSRVGEGHAVIDDPIAPPGQTRQEIIDRLGWLESQGVTWSSVPVPPLSSIQGYYDYTQWIAEEIMPAVR